MIYLTRKAEFAASHFYHDPSLSPEENQRLFGKCANINGHGHNYLLEVTVKGEVDPRTGMVLDLKDLKEVLNREVMEVMDHRFLNHEVAAFCSGGRQPTTENIAIEIWRMIEGKLSSGRLHCVRLYETENLFVDYYGE